MKNYTNDEVEDEEIDRLQWRRKKSESKNEDRIDRENREYTRMKTYERLQ